MAGVDYQQLIDRSRCLLCVPELLLEVLAVRLLADILLTKAPMADVSVSGLLARSREFMPLSKHELLAIMVFLMTDVAVSVSDVYVAGAVGLAEEPFFAGRMAYLLYLDVPGDGSGGHFYFDDLSMATHDDSDVIRPLGIGAMDAGRWIRSNNPT
jgi:hypothetical protein